MSRCEPESAIYARWEASVHTGARIRTVDGQTVVVISRGRRNESSGPDYLDAVLIINGSLSVGAVEMHRHERDWLAHGHETDPAYRQVILHVVGEIASPRVLELPTALVDGLGAIVPEARTPSAAGLSRELLVECAWARLLRRVTEITRAERELPIEIRLGRAFVRRLFDALGYATNRRPMRLVADAFLALGAVPSTFDGVASILFGIGGCDVATVRSLGAAFMSDERIERILEHRSRALATLRWHRSTRPNNLPERRLWAAARLLVAMKRERKLGRLLDLIASGATWTQLERELTVRFSAQSFIGRARASEIVMNALLPVALAAGIMRHSTALIEGACRLYRNAPSQQSNRIVRLVEHRYLDGRALDGGFWQQGAIELHQRYLAPDRSELVFVADGRGPCEYCVVRTAYRSTAAQAKR
jgi:hypothetical protein